MGDVVGVWEVSLSDGVHRIEFEHGTTSGKRIVRIDGKVSAYFHLLTVVLVSRTKNHIQYTHRLLSYCLEDVDNLSCLVFAWYGC